MYKRVRNRLVLWLDMLVADVLTKTQLEKFAQEELTSLSKTKAEIVKEHRGKLAAARADC